MRRGLMAWLTVGVVGLSVLSVMAADKAEQDLRSLVPKIVQAWESMDIGKVDSYYAADPDLAFFDIAPLTYANWAEYRTGVQKLFFEPNRSLAFKVNDDLRIHRRGRLAWATFTFGADVVSKQGLCERHRALLLAELPSRSFSTVRLLIVVERRSQDLYEYLRHDLTGVRGVEVIVDRRHGERRRGRHSVLRERRRADRRQERGVIHSMGCRFVRLGRAS